MFSFFCRLAQGIEKIYLDFIQDSMSKKSVIGNISFFIFIVLTTCQTIEQYVKLYSICRINTACYLQKHEYTEVVINYGYTMFWL